LALASLRQVEPVLEEQRVFTGEQAFETLDVGNALCQFALPDLAPGMAGVEPGIPVGEPDAEHSPRRQGAPAAPQGPSLFFFVAGFSEGARLDVARVHPLVEQLDGFALAGAVETNDQDDDRKVAELL